VGKWKYTTNRLGDVNAQFDIEFVDDGTCTIDSSFLRHWDLPSDCSFSAKGSDKGEIKFFNELHNYTIKDDVLRIYFSDDEHYNDYRRVK
jgi:hypothetical protein